MTPNEKHRLEVVIEQKDYALSDAMKRIDIYRIMIDDLSTQNRVVREELAYQTKFRELYEKSNKERGIENDRLREENERLKGENEMLDKMVSGNGLHLIKLVKRIEDATAILNPKFD